MWTLTPFGFYSAVKKHGDAFLTIRARVSDDLDALRDRYLPTLSPTVSGVGTDYPYRATCTPDAWGEALGAMGRDIDYANFKSEVGRRQGSARAHAYGKVWEALYGLEQAAPTRPRAGRVTAPVSTTAAPPAVGAAAPLPRHASGKGWAAGGVLVDAAGRVCLRLAAGRYGGDGWTWAKGKVDRGETMEEAAVREVFEETGIHAEIVSALAGEHLGDTSVTRYWRMRVLSDTGRFGTETEAVEWVTPDEARHRIRTTTRGAAKIARDLAVLDLALADVASTR
jgi:8-oxo-dGTP diphosphatase